MWTLADAESINAILSWQLAVGTQAYDFVSAISTNVGNKTRLAVCLEKTVESGPIHEDVVRARYHQSPCVYSGARWTCIREIRCKRCRGIRCRLVVWCLRLDEPRKDVLGVVERVLIDDLRDCEYLPKRKAKKKKKRGVLTPSRTATQVPSPTQ
jgi:hypothetical protein